MGSFRRSLPILLLTFVTMATPARVSADPIRVASAPIEIGMVFDATVMGARGHFIFAISPIIHRQLFNEILLTPADVGRTFVVDETSDPDVPYFIQLLTNGVGNYNEVQFATDRGTGGSGRAAEGPLFNVTAPDLQGLRIDAFSFTVHTFGVEPSVANGEVLWLRGTLSALAIGDEGVPAPTPEPASLVLVGSGIVAIIGRVRQRRKSR